MNSKELRIGNYVLINDVQVCVYHIEDEGINAVPLGDYLEDGDTWEGWFDNPYIEDKTIKGIELTAEILQKCGFIKGVNAYLFPEKGEEGFFNRMNIGYREEVLDDEFCVVSNPYDGWEVPCKYLHQLQNIIYLLTDTELKYNPS